VKPGISVRRSYFRLKKMCANCVRCFLSGALWVPRL
jgi:hypothetical protein